jgi:uncharacterized domain HDIG
MNWQNTTPWLRALFTQPIDWGVLEAVFPEAAAMRSCPQDPVFHAEGNVWTHTRMVTECLLEDEGFHAMPEEHRQVMLLAALLHDVGKPYTTETVWDAVLGRDRISQPGHARLGARMAWSLLWEAGVPLAVRQRVYWLIAWHQRPFHLLGDGGMMRKAVSFSLIGDWRELLMLANADNRGRISANGSETAETLELLRLWLEEEGLDRQPWPFANDESRMQYLEKPDRSLHYTAPPATGSKVVMLCGLPGSGKDTYARKALPDWQQVSLDDVRSDLGIDATGNQGAVIQEVQERARVFLRRKQPFIWNATNLTASLREKVIRLLRSYEAHVVIHTLDRSIVDILRQNASRPAVVPEAVVRRMIRKYEPPSVLEAHEVLWV